MIIINFGHYHGGFHGEIKSECYEIHTILPFEYICTKHGLG